MEGEIRVKRAVVKERAVEQKVHVHCCSEPLAMHTPRASDAATGWQTKGNGHNKL